MWYKIFQLIRNTTEFSIQQKHASKICDFMRIRNGNGWFSSGVSFICQKRFSNVVYNIIGHWLQNEYSSPTENLWKWKICKNHVTTLFSSSLWNEVKHRVCQNACVDIHYNFWINQRITLAILCENTASCAKFPS